MCICSFVQWLLSFFKATFWYIFFLFLFLFSYVAHKHSPSYHHLNLVTPLDRTNNNNEKKNENNKWFLFFTIEIGIQKLYTKSSNNNNNHHYKICNTWFTWKREWFEITDRNHFDESKFEKKTSYLNHDNWYWMYDRVSKRCS